MRYGQSPHNAAGGQHYWLACPDNQPIRVAGELGRTRGDELVSGINNRVLIQMNTNEY